MSRSSIATMPRVWELGFAGHRNLSAWEVIASAVRDAVADFHARVEGEVIGRSSAAAGADLLFLEACRDAGIRHTVVLPMPESRFREDFANPAEWERAKELIDGALDVETIPGHDEADEASYRL